MSRLSARAAGVVLALSALALTGCKSTKDRLHDILVDGFATEPGWASQLCAFETQGLTNVQVTQVANSGTSSSGSGTATVTGAAIPFNGMTAPGPCAGTIAFTYSTLRTGTRVTYTRRGGTRRSSTYTLQVDGITVTNRTGAMAGQMPGMMPGQMPGMMPGQMPGQMPGTVPAAMPGQMPGAMPGQMPGAVPGAMPVTAGSCAAYARCCGALTSTPGFEGMAGSCSQVAQLNSLGVQGQTACQQTLDSVRQSLAAMGGVPPACQ